ncbi:hypothetical protein MUK42_28298 [Musa troglodytarum]|uniref:Uncharacterized protein n=1 Tax=Musa troglodytarum TaxID=320322 RepID=A0A9E7JZN7_9LILI|nr:hypothetical protein MUK42_28298 [Musa troglodytarum]
MKLNLESNTSVLPSGFKSINCSLQELWEIEEFDLFLLVVPSQRGCSLCFLETHCSLTPETSQHGQEMLPS